ncbi:MmyB family transcriptional regulator [Nocardiopsis changdeensis]|uniref:MmyB family transcriptional regulator n=1 Tax=Nocardiopsis changdeensis TaxID=2831969 RepID=UPI003F486406
MLRLEAERDPMDGELTAPAGELSARSAVFARDRAEHDVHRHRTGGKSFRRPTGGPERGGGSERHGRGGAGPQRPRPAVAGPAQSSSASASPAGRR